MWWEDGLFRPFWSCTVTCTPIQSHRNFNFFMAMYDATSYPMNGVRCSRWWGKLCSMQCRTQGCQRDQMTIPNSQDGPTRAGSRPTTTWGSAW